MKESAKAASRPTGPQQRLYTAVLRNSRDFASLKEEWDELYQSCPSATPFQSWEWLYSWWEAYGEDYKLRLITLRDRDLLVGLLPLMVRRGRLLLVGDNGDKMTPYKDVLVKEGWEEPVARAGSQALKGLGGWLVADLQELRPEAAAWDLFREWDGPRASVPITNYVLVHARPWEELLMSVSRKARGSARRTLRRAEQDGIRFEPAALENAEQAARRLVALHRELWQARRIDPELLTPRYEALIEAAARRMTARGIGRISEFWRGDKVLVSQFLVFDRDFVGGFLIGASQEATRRHQFTTLGMWDVINVACSKGSAYVSLMHYVSQEKLRWASEMVSSHRAMLGRSRAFWMPYAGYYNLSARYYRVRSEVQSYVHSENCPLWIKNATERYYALQSYIHSERAPLWIKRATESYYALLHRYGYGWLRYRYKLARARREIRESKTSRKAGYGAEDGSK